LIIKKSRNNAGYGVSQTPNISQKRGALKMAIKNKYLKNVMETVKKRNPAEP